MLETLTISSSIKIYIFDYLELSVIPLTINKHLKLHYQTIKKSTSITLKSIQINEQEELPINQCPTLNDSSFDCQNLFLFTFGKNPQNYNMKLFDR